MADLFGELREALRRPEAFVVRWQGAGPGGGRRRVIGTLAVAAIGSLAVYGLTMGIPHGLGEMFGSALRVPLAATLAWGLSLPALYIINTALGSRLDLSTTTIAALTAVSFGALARLASAPLSWFFGVTMGTHTLLLAGLTWVVFGLTALAMVDVFLRVMRALEPKRSQLYPLVWLLVVGLVDVELKVLLSVVPR